MIAHHLSALTFGEDEHSLSPVEIALVLALHLAGLAAVWRYFQQPIWLALPTLALLLVFPSLTAWRTRSRLAIETLAPLFFLYAVLLVRVITIWFIRAPLPYQDESTLANARLLVFQIELAVIAVLAYIALVQIVRLARGVARTRILITLTLCLGVAGIAWFAAETIEHRTHGVTGTDPYAYVQMAVDLATRGSSLHAFPLFDEIKDLGIKWYPIQHIGYRLFENSTGAAATVWPLGGSLWLALTYSLGGETGLYLATPLAAIASLGVFAFLVWEYFRDQSLLTRASITAISVMLLATSWEQVDRSLVPLVDAQAQLFSLLAIGLALRGVRAKRLVIFGALAGLALGMAYFVRHTQVLLAIPIAVAGWQLKKPERFRFLVTTALVAFVVALPDLIYHRQNFGSWLSPESHELVLFGFSSIASSSQVVADRFFAGNEFGYLFPFFLYGAYRAARENAGRFLVLASWLVALVGFHLFYEALRMRDLLPEFPVAVLLTAYGIVALVRDLCVQSVIARSVVPWHRPPGQVCDEAISKRLGDCFLTGCFAITSLAMTIRQGVVAAVIFLALLLTLTRTQFTLMRVVQPAKVTFGYVTAAQRASFDQIAALTPANAVIGSTMNDGAIDLYANRATFRPGDWSSTEWSTFVDTMIRAGRRVFLLDDGAETSTARRDLAARYTLKQVAVLDVPLFSVVDGTAGALYEIIH